MTNPRALPKIVVASLQLLLLPVLQIVTFREAAAIEGLNPRAWPSCSLSDPLMDPTYEKRYGTPVIWQIPSNPKGVLFMAHAGQMLAEAYFDPGPKCQQCYGLPEYRRTVLEALRRGYAVIVVKSIGDIYDCTWPLETSPDLVIVTAVLKEWTREHALDGLPLAGMAVSSGGRLLTGLTTRLPMRAMVFMVGRGLPEVYERATPEQFPPTFFVEMPKDKDDSDLNTTGVIAEAMVILKERGVEVTYTEVWPKQLDPLIFSERILCISDEMSRKILEGLDAAGWLDGNRFVVVNPQWADVGVPLRKANVLPFCTASRKYFLQDHVKEEISNAFALHGHTSDADDAVFAWLDLKILRSSDEALVGTL